MISHGIWRDMYGNEVVSIWPAKLVSNGISDWTKTQSETINGINMMTCYTRLTRDLTRYVRKLRWCPFSLRMSKGTEDWTRTMTSETRVRRIDLNVIFVLSLIQCIMVLNGVMVLHIMYCLVLISKAYIDVSFRNRAFIRIFAQI